MKRLAVVGYPIQHSLSPKIFGFLKEYFGVSLEYDILDLNESKLSKQFPEILEKYDGLNITSPYKKKILPYASHLSKEVLLLESSNVIEIKKGTSDPSSLDQKDQESLSPQVAIKAWNTDIYGFKESLKDFLSEGESEGVNINALNVLIFGSGGASRSVILALKELGALGVYVRARNFDSLLSFKHQLQASFEKQNGIKGDFFIRDFNKEPVLPDIVIQATTIGLKTTSMSPPIAKESDVENANSSPYGLKQDELDFFNVDYQRTKWALDLNYSQLVTPFLDFVQDKRVRNIQNGLDMLVYQALRAFEIWFFPIENKKEVAKKMSHFLEINKTRQEI